MAPTPNDLALYATEVLRRGFELGDRIGGGSFGNVYRAKQISLGSRPVAVKFFDNRFGTYEDNRARFEREARLLARVEHRAIPYVITSGRVPTAGQSVPYTVMQLIRGVTLETAARDQNHDWIVKVEILSEVLAALAAAHHEEVIHRDVSPRNIMLGPSGTYLIDFSIGMCREYEPGLTQVTRAGFGIGAADYASPEQLKDARSVDHRTDIYSAGVVLFELLIGHCRVNYEELAAQDLPEQLVSAIRKSTAPMRDGRFDSAAEFREVLQDVLASRDLVASSGTSFCPNTMCEAAVWSETGYFRGPRILLNSRARHCEHCGVRLVRSCSRCRGPLPDNLETMVVTTSRDAPDRTSAFCSGCGTQIFKTPTCSKCTSFLRKPDMKVDTTVDGCAKCKQKRKQKPQPQTKEPTFDDEPFAATKDDDIPF